MPLSKEFTAELHGAIAKQAKVRLDHAAYEEQVARVRDGAVGVEELLRKAAVVEEAGR